MRYMTMVAALVIALNFTTQVRAERPVTEGAKVGEWTMDFEAAKALSKEKNLTMLMNFTGSDWCGWCKLMDKNVFSTDDWKKYAKDKLVLVFIDFPKDKKLVPEKLAEANKALSDKFEVQGYPTYILLASDGEKQLGRLSASRDATPPSFIQGIKKYTEWPAKIAKLSPEDKVIYDKAKAGQESVEKELKAWVETKPERNDENSKKFASFQERMKVCEKAISDLLDRQK
ncbi:MAG: thioredoxin family protein [bacterium]